jgi:hypothetical protein
LLSDLQLDADGPYDGVEELPRDGGIAPVLAAFEDVFGEVGQPPLDVGKLPARLALARPGGVAPALVRALGVVAVAIVLRCRNDALARLSRWLRTATSGH